MFRQYVAGGVLPLPRPEHAEAPLCALPQDLQGMFQPFLGLAYANNRTAVAMGHLRRHRSGVALR